MAAALDLGRKGAPVLVLDDNEGIGQGSRAICFAKRTLEMCDRLGAGQTMVDKGMVWNVGKVLHGDERVFEFNLQPAALRLSTCNNPIVKSSLWMKSARRKPMGVRFRSGAVTRFWNWRKTTPLHDHWLIQAACRFHGSMAGSC